MIFPHSHLSLEKIGFSPYNQPMSETNYEFVDCGQGRRLERFGEILIDRPAPQADFKRKLSSALWQKADASFIRGEDESHWEFREPGRRISLEENFRYLWDGLRMELKFSENGQIGIYPEQRENWQWIKELTRGSKIPLRVLNGFAYTGGSTLSASLGGKQAAGADVCHLDASRSAVNWARRNAENSGLTDQTIRFVVEDIIRFMEREIKRGRQYQGIILDPPAFGRAPGKKTWVLKRDLSVLMDLSRQLFRKEPRFFLLSCHDPEVSKSTLADQLRRFDGIPTGQIETKDLVIPSENGNSLPNGIVVRWKR